ncbi:hypothetical protein [Zobellia nedashkovskayae]|uniref:hypothetical protein n=1 Tax=Zobellia nedashkovskayae TaxID=2779510 RepID=UPI00188AAE7B|nr:hypothetical protein [Zobellia nedashkovskayae]
MEEQIEITKLLTHERFQYGRLTVKEKLIQLKEKGLIDDLQFNKIQDEDILLKVKYTTYKKCVKQIVIALVLTIIGFFLVNASPLSGILIIIGFILAISSFFGITSNRLTKIQKVYLKN